MHEYKITATSLYAAASIGMKVSLMCMYLRFTLAHLMPDRGHHHKSGPAQQNTAAAPGPREHRGAHGEFRQGEDGGARRAALHRNIGRQGTGHAHGKCGFQVAVVVLYSGLLWSESN